MWAAELLLIACFIIKTDKLFQPQLPESVFLSGTVRPVMLSSSTLSHILFCVKLPQQRVTKSSLFLAPWPTSTHKTEIINRIRENPLTSFSNPETRFSTWKCRFWRLIFWAKCLFVFWVKTLVNLGYNLISNVIKPKHVQALWDCHKKHARTAARGLKCFHNCWKHTVSQNNYGTAV